MRNPERSTVLDAARALLGIDLLARAAAPAPADDLDDDARAANGPDGTTWSVG